MFRNTVIVLLFALIGGHASADIPVAGFSDVGIRSIDDGTNKSSSFYLGAIDFYYARNLGENVSVLAEIVYEFNAQNEAVLDPERLYIQYYVSPLLQIKAGREHIALGYWNNTFHHGSWLQTSISRPLMYRFEDDGGILPVHNIGLELSGGTQLGAGEINYVLSVGNGRNVSADPPQNVNDANTSLATNLLVYYTLGDFRFGANYYKDDLAGRNVDANGNAAAFNSKGSETISGAHFAYTATSGFELLAEYLEVKHKYETGAGEETKLSGSYAQISYLTGKWTPYYRYDSIKAGDVEDQYLGLANDKTGSTYGVRYDLTSTSALKAESSVVKEASVENKELNLNWSFAW